MVNPVIAKEKAMSSQGRAMANELEELNWKMQMLEFEINKLSNEYIVKKCEYKIYLGYELNDEDKDSLKKAKEELK